MPKIRSYGLRSYWTVVRLMERVGEHVGRGLRWWLAGRTAAALEMLGDDVLRDIGITRAEIPAVARRVTAPAAPIAGRYRPATRPISVKEVTT